MRSLRSGRPRSASRISAWKMVRSVGVRSVKSVSAPAGAAKAKGPPPRVAGWKMARSASVLADLGGDALHFVEGQVAAQHLVVHHEGWRAGDVEALREGAVLSDDCGHFVAVHLRLDRGGVEAEALGHAVKRGLRDIAREDHERVVDLCISLVTQGLQRGNGKARGQFRLFAQDREFLDDQLDVAVEFQ